MSSTKVPFLTVAEDLEWLRDEWWLGESDMFTDGHLRRGSVAIGRLVNDGLVQSAWTHYGFQNEPTIVGPDISAMAAHAGLRLDLARVVAGGGRVSARDMTMIGLFRIDNPETGIASDADAGFAVATSGLVLDATVASIPRPDDAIIKRRWSLSDYLAAPGVVSGGCSISRRSVIEYFRRLDELRMPAVGEAPHQDSDNAFSLLAELEGLVHADERDGVHFELLSIG